MYPHLQELKECLDYNPLTGDFIWKKPSSRRFPVALGSKAGSLTTRGYISIWFRGKAYTAQQLAIYMYYGKFPQELVIFKNGKKDDLRIENLSEVVNVKAQPITQDNIKKWFLYLPDQGIFIRKISMNTQAIEGTIAGARTKNGYILISVGLERIYAHRLAFFYMKGYWPETVDHINRNKLDNRWENLREATYSEQGCNKVQDYKAMSGYKGVYYSRNKDFPWRVEIRKDNIIHRFGSYKTLEEANEVAIREREKLHKEFCNHD